MDKIQFDFHKRFVKMITNPKEMFDDMAERPSRIPPLLVTAIVLTIITLLSWDKATYVNDIIAQYKAMETELPANPDMIYYGEVFRVVYVAILGCLLKAFMMTGIANMRDGYERGIKHGFAIVMYSFTVVVLGKIVWFLMFNVIGLNFMESLGPVMQQVIRELNPFNIWYQALCVIGVSRVFKISIKESLPPVLAPWVAWMFISLGLSGMGV